MAVLFSHKQHDYYFGGANLIAIFWYSCNLCSESNLLIALHATIPLTVVFLLQIYRISNESSNEENLTIHWL